MFFPLSANTAVVVANEDSRGVSVFEIACTFDTSREEPFMTKVLKYQPLVDTISGCRCACALLVFIFGSLGKSTGWFSEDYSYLGCPRRKMKMSPSIALSLQLLAAAISGGDAAECRLKCAFIIFVCIVSMWTYINYKNVCVVGAGVG